MSCHILILNITNDTIMQIFCEQNEKPHTQTHTQTDIYIDININIDIDIDIVVL